MNRCGLLLLALAGALALAAPAGASQPVAPDQGLAAFSPVPVYCVAPADWSAFTSTIGLAGAQGIFDGTNRTISIPSGSCDLLHALGRGYRPHAQLVAAAMSQAVFVFGHEIAHADGIDDEDAADCRAARTLPGFARRLGATRAYAGELAGYAIGALSGRLPDACMPAL